MKLHRVAGITILVLVMSIFLPAGFGYVDSLSSSTGYAGGFWIDQNASTSGGTVQRHADISSPWSGAYIYEDSTMVGRIEIKESFSMGNIGTPPSKNSPGDDFFDQSGSSSVSAGNNSSEQQVITSSAGETTSELERVLGISIYANLTWLDLF